MTDAHPAYPDHVGSEEPEPTGPRITDKRRIDPQTGAVRAAPGAGLGQDTLSGGAAAAAGVLPGETTEDLETEGAPELPASEEVNPDTTLAADLTRDLQRLQAEYVNYKKRVDRDRAMHREMAVGSVIEALLPVLDDIRLARQHGDLEGGPFAAISDKLDGTLTKIGVERFGQPGDTFDPNVHEALMHVEAELAAGTVGTTVVQVLQPGYRMAQRLIRPARVAVADPQPVPQPDPPANPQT